MLRVFIISITFLSLMSCFFSVNTAPTVERGRPSPNQLKTHTVTSGETLFAISWRYGLDYRVLARFNSIGSDFLIYPGQSLKLPTYTQAISGLSTTAKKITASSERTPTKAVKVRKSATKMMGSPQKSNTSTSTALSTSRSKKGSTSKIAVTRSKQKLQNLIWQWPAKGKVVTNFSKTKGGNKGINIRGKKGDSVQAASSGQVVYAGSGLRGYGKLVIIKHSDTYLSAYAHNDKIRVKEGQWVKAGQHIADIGSSGSRTDIVKLHFEIRQDGQPINPLRLLPKRKT
ncbi:hypothetical protein AB835_13055 [Candidatus Endobugula sertula]|uniref:LysM domain-containing protein n=1 Tax=Candidatus Endobugula sertula TaxID=62101 RepID=A0A1D2QM53_9GAMM|nr:hypothetical protein AB835_13055 [Candidatus Endobugula sertula]